MLLIIPNKRFHNLSVTVNGLELVRGGYTILCDGQRELDVSGDDSREGHASLSFLHPGSNPSAVLVFATCFRSSE